MTGPGQDQQHTYGTCIQWRSVTVENVQLMYNIW